MIPKSVTKQVIDATDIVEVVNEVVPLKKKGTSYFGLCPFHDDKNPSMSVSGEKKIFNCFSCGTKGNVIYFVAKYNNISIEQATLLLAKRAGIKIEERFINEDAKQKRFYNIMNEAYNFYHFYLQNTEEGLEALKYLHERGISTAEIEKFKIGLAPSASNYLNQALIKKDITDLDQIELGLVRDRDGKIHDIFRERIMFSISNSFGQIVGFSGRIYNNSDQAKYINSIDNYIFHKGEILYNLNNAIDSIRRLNQIFIFEGFMDVIAVSRANILNAVATMGTALTDDHIKQIIKITKNIVLFFDGDEAGIKAMKRSCYMFGRYNIIPNAVLLPDNLDPDEYIAKYGNDKFNEFIQNNMKNAYLVMYQHALKNVYFDDFVSQQNFKNEVFSMIHMANSEVITNYFLNKLSEDLKIDRSLLGFDKANFEQIDYNTNKKETKEEVTKVKKIVKVTPKVVIAYNTIIKFSINSKDLFSTAFLSLSKDNLIRYPGAELCLHYDLLYFLCTIYSEYKDREGLSADELYELLKDKPDVLLLAKKIIDDPFIDTKNNKLFDDSLNTINEYFTKLDNAASYNAALFATNDTEQRKNADEFVILSKNQKKIVNEEDI